MVLQVFGNFTHGTDGCSLNVIKSVLRGQMIGWMLEQLCSTASSRTSPWLLAPMS